MIFVVMDGAERDRKFVADLEGQAFGLRISNMMRMGWGAATNQAGLMLDIAQLLPGSLQFPLVQSQYALVRFASSPGIWITPSRALP